MSAHSFSEEQYRALDYLRFPYHCLAKIIDEAVDRDGLNPDDCMGIAIMLKDQNEKLEAIFNGVIPGRVQEA